jgi:alkylation response protein AidB-like acyl-CoA dehydrogenase
MAAEMERNDAVTPNAGCRFYALAAKALNETIVLAHDHRLTRQQYVMFSLADMMIHVEIGVSMARKVSTLAESERPETEKIRTMSRIFAGETAHLVANNSLKIIMGCGLFDHDTVSRFLETISHQELFSSYRNIINDMDFVADILFERGDHGK